MNKDYYTVEQISEMLDIHPKTVQRYTREGKLRAAKVGKGWRVMNALTSACNSKPPELTDSGVCAFACL